LGDFNANGASVLKSCGTEIAPSMRDSLVFGGWKMQFLFGRRMKAAHLLVAFIVALASLTTQSARAQELSYVRIVHAVPGLDKVDFYIDGKKHLNDITYSAVTKYLRIPNGRRNFRFILNGTAIPFSDAYRNVNRAFYTLVIYGPRARPRVMILNESAGVSPRANQSRVTLLNLSDNSRPLTLGASYNGTRYRRFVSNVRYGTAKYFYAPSGDVNLLLKSGNSTIRTQKSTLRPGRRHTYFIIGRIGAPGKLNLRLMDEDAASQ
jgi:hypothetical protein